MAETILKNSVSVDEKKIDDIVSRSVAEILPSREALKKELLSGRRLRIYIGADATGPSLHIGHATNFILLEKLRRLGHEVFVLFGDFTAMIGDPAGKESARRPLSSHEVKENIRSWKKQLSPLLSFDDRKNPAKIVKNSAWLSKLKLDDVLKLAASFTVQHMIERDMFEQRIKKGIPIYLHEFLYPLLQGYDSVALNVDIEIGGTDQTFNMLAGRILQKKYNNREKFVISTTLLENPETGKKLMSKSEGNFIGLSDSPSDIYGKTMALPDGVIVQVFTDSTNISIQDIEQMKKELESGGNPRDVKMKLAFELAALVHGKKNAEKAQKKFIETFQKKEFPGDAKTVLVRKGSDLKGILFKEGVITSTSEFLRLLKGGAIKNADSGEKIVDPHFVVVGDMRLKIGKKTFLKIMVK